MKKILIILSILLTGFYLAKAINLNLSSGSKLDSFSWQEINNVTSKINLGNNNLNINGKLVSNSKICSGEICLAKCDVGEIWDSSSSTCLPDFDGESCYIIKQHTLTANSGVYKIDPDGIGGNNPFDAYCDMTSDGGGWTLIAKTFAGEDAANSTKVGDISNYNSGSFAKFSDANINLILSSNSGQRYVKGSGLGLTSYWKIVDNTFSWDSTGATDNGSSSATAKTHISKTGIDGTYYTSWRYTTPGGYYNSGVHYWGYFNSSSHCAGYSGTSSCRNATGGQGFLTYQSINSGGSGSSYRSPGGPVWWYIR